MFARLAAIYTHKWTSCFPNKSAYNVAVAEWSNALAPLSDWQIRYGIQRCRDSANEWPPTIPSFIRLACNLPTLDSVIARLLSDDELTDPVSIVIARRKSRKWLRGESTNVATSIIRAEYDDSYKAALSEVSGIEGFWHPPARLEKKPEEPKEIVDPEYAAKAFKEAIA